MGVSPLTGKKRSVSTMSGILAHIHTTKHQISPSDFKILSTASSEADLLIRESQCRINHMAEAAYATGPALLGAPRLLSSISPRIFCSLFHRGARTVRQCGAPKSLSSTENVRPQNLKSA